MDLGAQPSRWYALLWATRRAASKAFRIVGLSGAATIAVPCGNAEELPKSDHLWRRLVYAPNHLSWDDDHGRWIPDEGDLKFNPDLSTSWREHLRMHRQGPATIVNETYGAVGEVAIDRVCLSGFRAEHTPNEDSTFGCAHASIDYPPSTPLGKGRKAKDARSELRYKLAREFTWVYGATHPDVPRSGPTGQ